MFDPRYEAQLRLLLRCLPLLHDHPEFAVKGGTAINLFVQPLPRLSVDIDLVFVPLKPRSEALADITRGLSTLKREIQETLPNATVQEQHARGQLARLLLAGPEASTKVEVNLIFRGAIHPPERAVLCDEAQRCFQAYAHIRRLHVADLYGGKLCAALDRQHPRDLYDVKLLLENTGIRPDIRRAFVVYLAGHNRPMSELLEPHIKDIDALYKAEFVGMCRRDVPLRELREVQRELPLLLRKSLDEDERAFLLSLKRGEPEWDRLGIGHLADLPALQWKLRNIRLMEENKHRAALRKLEGILLS